MTDHQQTTSHETTRKIARNTLWNSAGFAVTFLSSVYLLPKIIHTLGDRVYGGIWAIIGTLTATIGLLDLGTGTAFVKFIAEYYTKKDEKSLSEVVNTGMAMYAAFGMILVAVATLWGGEILRTIGVEEPLIPDGRFVLMVGMFVFVLANVLAPLTSISIGIQRMDINAKVIILTQLINIATTSYVLAAGWGVRGLIVNNLFTITLSSVLLVYAGKRFIPSIRFAPRFCRWAMAMNFFRYGLNLQASRVAGTLTFQFDRILMLRLFGPSAVTYYDIGARLCTSVRTVSFLAVSAIMPAAAELDAREERGRLLGLYRKGNTYATVAAAFFFAFVIVFAEDIITAWMGKEYLAAVTVIRILGIGYFTNIITGVGSSLAAGMGKTGMEGKGGIAMMALNLTATVGLGWLLGPLGIAIGISVSLIGGALVFFVLLHRYLGNPGGIIVRSLLKPMLPGTLASLTALAVRTAFFPAVSGFWEGVGVLVAALVVHIVVTALLARALGLVDPSDVRLLRGVLSLRGREEEAL